MTYRQEHLDHLFMNELRKSKGGEKILIASMAKDIIITVEVESKDVASYRGQDLTMCWIDEELSK